MTVLVKEPGRTACAEGGQSFTGTREIRSIASGCCCSLNSPARPLEAHGTTSKRIKTRAAKVEGELSGEGAVVEELGRQVADVQGQRRSAP